MARWSAAASVLLTCKELPKATACCTPGVLRSCSANCARSRPRTDQIEIFFNAQILPKTEALLHVTDFPLNCLAFGNHVVTQNPTASVVSSEQSAKNAQKRGLAAAVWTKEPVDLARRHR